MKVLVDTNVALDILLNRSDFYSNSMAVFVLAEQKLITGHISASAVTDIFYIAQKQLGKKAAQEAIKRLLQVFLPAAVTGNNIYQALELAWDDLEDSVQFTVGKALSADFIITRDTRDFTLSSISAVTPEQFMQTITGISYNN